MPTMYLVTATTGDSVERALVESNEELFDVIADFFEKGAEGVVFDECEADDDLIE